VNENVEDVGLFVHEFDFGFWCTVPSLAIVPKQPCDGRTMIIRP
jgi:hypothetical protein